MTSTLRVHRWVALDLDEPGTAVVLAMVKTPGEGFCRDYYVGSRLKDYWALHQQF